MKIEKEYDEKLCFKSFERYGSYRRYRQSRYLKGEL